MKCPKCGYNSFEIHDICKRCSNDLSSYKDIHGLKPIVLPLETRTAMAEKMMAGKLEEEHAPVVDVPADMFSFDIPGDESGTATTSFKNDDPFDFGDEPASSVPADDFSFTPEQMSAQAKAEEDAFADLLESNAPTQGAEPAATDAAAADSQIESELSSFAWDDVPAPAGTDAAKPVEDDFNSLFGDTDDTTSK
jgi:hypothetical protein